MSEEILTLDEVLAAVKVSRSSLYGMISARKFPRPLELSARRRGWLRSDIEAWIEARRLERDGGSNDVSR